MSCQPLFCQLPSCQPLFCGATAVVPAVVPAAVVPLATVAFFASAAPSGGVFTMHGGGLAGGLPFGAGRPVGAGLTVTLGGGARSGVAMR